MLRPQRGTIPALPPVWVSHTSLRRVIPAGKGVAAPGREGGNVLLDFGVAPWRFHSSRSRRNPWAALCPPSTHPQRSTSRNLRVFLTPKWNFTRIFPAETQGCFCWPSGSAWSPRSAARPPPLLPWDVPGREAGMRRAGNAESGWEAVPTPGAERPCSAPCCAHAPAPCGTVPPLRQIRSFPVGIEVVKAEGRAAAWTHGKLFLLGCFPSRRVKNPAEAHPG